MPSYRAGKVIRKERTILRRSKGEKRVYIRKLDWFSDGSSIKHIEKILKFPIQATVKKMCKTGSPTVVDWGCAKGFSSAELARSNPNARVYGFSRESYKEWNKLLNKDKLNSFKPNKNLKFIHAEAREFFRYFKNDSIDLLFSSFGILHLADVSGYLINLVPKLKKGGIVVTNCSVPYTIYSQLQKSVGSTIAFSKYEVDIKMSDGGVIIKRLT